MIATVKLYEPNFEFLKTVNKKGSVKPFKWVVEVGPFVFVKPSEKSAHNFLTKKGFVLSDDCTHYYPLHKSDDQIDLENLYTKVR